MALLNTPVDAIQYSDGDDPIAGGDDLIKALALAVDGRLHDPGDLKEGMQTADHGYWVVADGRNNVVRANVSPAFNALMDALGYAGSDGAHVGIPDFRGRSVVGLGQHLEVAALGPAQAVAGKSANDGLAVASRTPRHTSTVNDPGHRHRVFSYPGLVNDGRSLPLQQQPHDYTDDAGAGPLIESSHTGITVGPGGARPVDGPAYGVANIFIFVGHP